MASLQHLHAQSADYANAADRSDIVETLAAAFAWGCSIGVQGII